MNEIFINTSKQQKTEFVDKNGEKMKIKKLTQATEWLECDKLHSIAFLSDDWNEKEAMERFQKQERGEIPREEEAWGLYSGEKMVTSVVSGDRRYTFYDGNIKIGELHMVGSLPEERGHGYVRELMKAILSDYQKRGYPMAMLIPFSFAFYRKFGFEVCSNVLKQKVSIDQFASFQNELRAKLMDCEEDLELVRKLYDSYIRDKNLAYIKTEQDYKYRGNGEFGKPDFFYAGNRQYTYLFLDNENQAKGYLKFIYVQGAEGPFAGDMHVQEIIYDTPETFRNMLGFIGGMSAKIRNVEFEMLEDLDLTDLLPEGDQIERTLDSHILMRALNVKDLLSRICTDTVGSFTIEVQDEFLGNTEKYEVILDGDKTDVNEANTEADITVSIQTFTQLITGKIGAIDAAYKVGTIVRREREILKKVFVKKAIAVQ